MWLKMCGRFFYLPILCVHTSDENVEDHGRASHNKILFSLNYLYKDRWISSPLPITVTFCILKYAYTVSQLLLLLRLEQLILFHETRFLLLHIWQPWDLY